MKRILLFCVLLTIGIVCRAGTIVNGTIKVADNRIVIVYLKEMLAANEKGRPYQQEVNLGAKRSFTFKMDIGKSGFYTLTVVTEKEKNKSAHNSIIYLTPNTKLNLEFQGNSQFGLVCNDTKISNPDNKALLEVYEKNNSLIRNLYTGTPDLSRQKEALQQFYVLADSVLANEKLSPMVKKYLKFQAFDMYNANLYRLASDYNRGSKNNVPVGTEYYIQPVDPLYYFNDAMTLMFYTGVSNVIRYLELQTGMPLYKSRKSLVEINTLIAHLKSKVSNEQLVDRVIESLLGSFTASYKAGANFDSDLKAYSNTASQIKDFAIRTSVNKGFENLRYTMIGAKLPALQFEDAEGNTQSLDQFKGKYLFIDLWASWCVPCIKMTPYVQELEKQYEGKNITFVAISIDGNRQNWLSKMQELNLHGHQLLDQAGAFTKSLNITGIPHYLIYDPQGKLIVYKGDMPDDPKLKVTIDQLPGL